MNRNAPDHPWLLFALIYGLSVPFWILGTRMKSSGLPDNLPVTDIGAVLTPTIAAVILRYREAGSGGVRELFGRIFDHRRIANGRWLVAAIVVFPLLYLATYVAMRVLGYSMPTVWHLSPALVGVFLLFFVAAVAEELGYSAYETDALQRRMTALNAALAMGPLWALWHLPSMIAIGQSTELILWGLCGTVAVRILNVWIYNNAGESLFAIVLMHAIGNTARTGYPGGRTGYELGHGSVAYSIIILFALIVIALWRPSTLASFLGRKSTSSRSYAAARRPGE
jgi:membrane protease YdiL (CAAX protease family)